MGGAEDVMPISGLGQRITTGLRDSTKPGLWAQTRDGRSGACPEDEDNQQRLQAYNEECYTKL